MELKVVLYKAGQIVGQKEDILEVITDDFNKWLDNHNKERVADGQSIEGEDEFRVEDMDVIIFNKKNWITENL